MPPTGEAEAEGWPSGRRRTPGKCVDGDESSRGFESRPLRHYINDFSRLYDDWRILPSLTPYVLHGCGRMRANSWRPPSVWLALAGRLQRFDREPDLWPCLQPAPECQAKPILFWA